MSFHSLIMCYGIFFGMSVCTVSIKAFQEIVTASVSDDLEENRDLYTLTERKHLMRDLERLYDMPKLKGRIYSNYNAILKSYGLEPVSMDHIGDDAFLRIPAHLAQLRLNAIGKELANASYEHVGQAVAHLLETLKPWIRIEYKYLLEFFMYLEVNIWSDEEIFSYEAYRRQRENGSDYLNKDDHEEINRKKVACIEAYNALSQLLNRTTISSFEELLFSKDWISWVLDYMWQKRLAAFIGQLTRDQQHALVELGQRQEAEKAIGYSNYVVVTSFINFLKNAVTTEPAIELSAKGYTEKEIMQLNAYNYLAHALGFSCAASLEHLYIPLMRRIAHCSKILLMDT